MHHNDKILPGCATRHIPSARSHGTLPALAAAALALLLTACNADSDSRDDRRAPPAPLVDGGNAGAGTGGSGSGGSAGNGGGGSGGNGGNGSSGGHGGGEAAKAIEPFSLFGPRDGVNANAAHTVDVGNTIDDILEHDRLIAPDGTTACDKYFGWGGEPVVKTEEQKILCGKYQFFYEHWSTEGLPKMMVEFNEKWFPQFFGNEFEKLGYTPNRHFKRVVTDVVPLAAGERGQRQQCDAGFSNCQTVEGPVATEDTWQEVYTLVADDQLPVGFQLGPKKSFGFDGAGFACAGCHMGRLPDGRYAVGMANQHLNYGQLLTGFLAPTQVSTAAMTSQQDPRFGELLAVFAEYVPEMKKVGEFMTTMNMHPGMMFNNPSTAHAHYGPAYEAMMNDLKLGTCYYGRYGELLRCDHHNAQRGPDAYRQIADDMLALLQEKNGTVTTGEWVMAMKEFYGVAYCLPAPMTPAMIGAGEDVEWAQFEPSPDPSQTFKNMAESCSGLRWNIEYWREFSQLLAALGNPQLLSAPMLSVSDQDLLINAGFNVLDFLLRPLSDDLVWTLSKIANVVGIPDQATLDAHPNMRTAGGRNTQMLSMAGTGRSLTQFASGFVMLSGSVDPRFVECDDPNIVGNWEASPNGSCRVRSEYVQPLVAYIESLKTPYPVNDVAVANADIQRGAKLFEQECQACHDGPSGQSSGVFLFGQREELTEIPLCAPDQRPVEWSDTVPPEPTYHHCRPVYTEVPADVDIEEDISRFVGFIATDPTYGRFAQPDPETGRAGVNPELAKLGKLSQGVKAQRLTGVRYKSELLHHGQLHDLDELLCRAGTRRETAEQRSQTFCMGYDLTSSEGLETYKANNGDGICLQDWQPLAGHEFGCELSDDDKGQLIDYLKTL